MEEVIKEIQKSIRDLPAIRTDISWIKKHLQDNGFVKKSEFQPVKNIVYGAVKLILTGVVLGGLALIIVPII